MSWWVHLAIHVVIDVAYLLASSICYGQVCQIIDADGAKGSAVCIGTRSDDGTGVFFTAGHCVADAAVWLAPEGKWLKAEPWAYWADGPGRDFALVYCSGYKPKSVYSIGTATPAVGSEVTVCGFALGGQLTIQKTRVRGHGLGTLDLDCRGVKGVSGGPVLVGKTVVGILTHDDYGNRCGVCTNIETINAALKSWRASPNQTAWGIGIGMGSGRCGPYGCTPFVPMYPAPVAPVVPVQPYYPSQPYAPSPAAPQQPGYPGFDTSPTTPPAEPAKPYDDAELRKRISELEAATGDLNATLSALNVRLKSLPSGPPGEPGPQGPPGKDGVGANPNELAALKADMAALKAIKIPVRIVDANGKVLSEQQYDLGKPLEFRFTEQK